MGSDHDASGLAPDLILRFDQTSLNRSDPKHVEELSSNRETIHRAGLARGPHNSAACGPGKDAGQRVVMLFDLLPHRHGEVGECTVFDPNSSRIAVGDAQFHQLAGFCDGEGAQSHGVQDLEDRGVRADAERERGDDDEGKA